MQVNVREAKVEYEVEYDVTCHDRTLEGMKINLDRRRGAHTSDKSKERFHNFLGPSRVSCPVAHLHVDIQVIVP